MSTIGRLTSVPVLGAKAIAFGECRFASSTDAICSRVDNGKRIFDVSLVGGTRYSDPRCLMQTHIARSLVHLGLNGHFYMKNWKVSLEL